MSSTGEYSVITAYDMIMDNEECYHRELSVSYSEFEIGQRLLAEYWEIKKDPKSGYEDMNYFNELCDTVGFDKVRFSDEDMGVI